MAYMKLLFIKFVFSEKCYIDASSLCWSLACSILTTKIIDKTSIKILVSLNFSSLPNCPGSRLPQVCGRHCREDPAQHRRHDGSQGTGKVCLPGDGHGCRCGLWVCVNCFFSTFLSFLAIFLTVLFNLAFAFCVCVFFFFS